MEAGERIQRLLSWCQFPENAEAWTHETAEQCRKQLPQIARSAMEVQGLPAMFVVPLKRYLDEDHRIDEVIMDDDRLLLMLSDMRDYLQLQQRGYL